MSYNIKKIAMFTDIHWGAKVNSQLHNQDCDTFIDWFCDMVHQDHQIDCVCFLGDWNENRSALNVSTINYSYIGAKKLNDLGIPIFFIIGNHDLYYRTSREIHSIVTYAEFTNFVIIDEPTIIPNKQHDIFLCPFMFPDEYTSLQQYLNIPLWLGHFEFKGFEVTGYGMKMTSGPSASDFKGPTYILSGHFHKRQQQPNCNVVYIGNAFPTNFGDTGDINRGMATYKLASKELKFVDWSDCPKYTNTTVSALSQQKLALHSNSRVRCVCDIPIEFDESVQLKEYFTKKYNLREFTLEESSHNQTILTGAGELKLDDTHPTNTSDQINNMLLNIDSNVIDSKLLSSIFMNLGK